MPVAKSSLTAMGNQDFLSRLGQICKQIIVGSIADHGSRRNRDNNVISAFSMHFLNQTRCSVACFNGFGIAQLCQSCFICVDTEIDVAALAAVTAERTAIGIEFLSAPGNTASAAIACFHVQLNIINHAAPPLS